MLLVSNLARLPQNWVSKGGVCGQSIRCASVVCFLRYCFRRDSVFVINCDPALLLKLCALFAIFPFFRRPLVAVDLVLREPRGWTGWLRAAAKRMLLRRVDHFIHHFKDLEGYQQVYGIGPERSSFVFFKPNIRYEGEAGAIPEGDYVLCFGRSLRDFDTFFAAMETRPYPGAIPRPDFRALAEHGARFSRDLNSLPDNVQLLPDDGSEESQVRCLLGARLVVLPVLKTKMPSGASTALNSMLLGKCVIGSEVPEISDVFEHEVITVPPEDPQALAAAIDRAWKDDELRHRISEAGRRLALSLGGEPELYQRIIDDVVVWLTNANAPSLR